MKTYEVCNAAPELPLEMSWVAGSPTLQFLWNKVLSD